MNKHINLQDIVEANQLLMNMGAPDQLPVIAQAAIERSLELQHRIDRAVAYAEQTHTSSLHARQMLRILDGSVTLDDEANEVIPEPVVHRQPLADIPRQSLAQAPKKERGGLGPRSTAERKAFREWSAEQGMDLPLNQTVPQHLIDAFDEATEGRYKPKPRKAYRRGPGPRGKLKPGHGLDGRSPEERLHLRQWLTEQGFDVNPTGRIPQSLISHYDDAMDALKRLQQENRKKQPQPEQQEQEHERHAQGA